MSDEGGGDGGRGLTRKDFLVGIPVAAMAVGMGLRRFGALGGTEAGAAHASVMPGFGMAAGKAAYAGAPIGVQLYTLRSLMGDDMEGVLSALAEMGYQEVEFAGLWGRTPAEMRAILDGLGLKATSSHHGQADIRSNWEATLEGAATLGQKYVVIPGINGDERTLSGLHAVADEFNAAAESAKAMGLGFGYHNHDWELQPLPDGTLPLDLLLERCDADLVTIEMDIFWTIHGGADPLEYFGAYPGRFACVHVKDRTADGQMVAVGEGVIDYATILGRAEQAGIQHYYVEHDNPGDDPLGNVHVSIETLQGILG